MLKKLSTDISLLNNLSLFARRLKIASLYSLFKSRPNVKLEGKIGRDNCASTEAPPPAALVTEFNLFKLLFTYAKLERLAAWLFSEKCFCLNVVLN